MEYSNKGKEVAKNIRITFEKNMQLLEPRKQRHFITRLYRITKDETYKKQVVAIFLKEKDKILKDLDNVYNQEHARARSEELFNKLLARQEKKFIKRQEIFSNKKEYLFYYRIIEQLYLLKTLGIHSNKHFKNGISFIKKSKHEKYLLEEELIEHYGTQLINHVYSLDYLRIKNLKKEFEKKFKKIFMKDVNDYMYKNKIYGMTHFIIAASNYYQNYVSSKEYGWVINYFKTNIKKILEKTNADIISEVGLCFKLCKADAEKETEMITEYLTKEYDEQKGYIPRLKGDISSSEHTNIISHLFLCQFKKLYKGPNIRKEIQNL